MINHSAKMFSCGAISRGARPLVAIVARRGLATDVKGVERASIPLVNLWKGVKKAPKVEKKNLGFEKGTITQEEPKRLMPEKATPKMMNTDLMTFLNWRAMARRRAEVDIPVFAPGSILQITALDSADSPRPRSFVGIVIARTNKGLGSTVTLRNSVDDIAIEKQYQLYSPLIKEIKLLRYERARRAKLYYLRDRPARESYVNPKQFNL